MTILSFPPAPSQSQIVYRTRADLRSHPAFANLSTDTSGNPCVFCVQYHCECGGGTSWSSEWSCVCDDECPVCGYAIEGAEEWIGPSDPVAQALWEGLPDAGEDPAPIPSQKDTAMPTPEWSVNPTDLRAEAGDIEIGAPDGRGYAGCLRACANRIEELEQSVAERGTVAPESAPVSDEIAITVSPAEHATILAALRFYQESGMGDPANRSDAIHDIATCLDEVISLDEADIDDLYEKLN